MPNKAAVISKYFDEFYIQKDVESILATIEYSLLLLEIESFSPAEELQLYYSLGTVHGDFLHLGADIGVENEYLLEQQIFYFRKAIDIYDEHQKDVDIIQIPQLYTNLGNTYLTVGKIFEAIALYNNALEIFSKHPIAIGNRGRAYHILGNIVWDPGYQQIYYHSAYNQFSQALKNQLHYPHPQAYELYDQDKLFLESHFDKSWLDTPLQFDDYDLGEPEEEAYRLWCLENTLFLNPVNDVLKISATAHDPIHLPSIVRPIEYDSRLHGFYNLIKQEYVSSRYLFYEAIQPKTQEHFSDRQVKILNTLDYAIHSLSDFKMKMAYRALYSLLDKIAFFMNQYFQIGIEEKDVSFRSIWLEEKSGRNGYRYENPILSKTSENLALGGMYWISKDFYEVNNRVIKPKSRILKDLRDQIEHKYSKTTMFPMVGDDRGMRGDQLAFYITDDELQDYTFDLMKTIRSLLLYVVIAVHIEEEKKNKENGDRLTVSIDLPPIEDEWKL
jgi:tetratricopeptide (TPR) repeat protein